MKVCHFPHLLPINVKKKGRSFIYFKRCQEIFTMGLESKSLEQIRYAILEGKYGQTRPALQIFCQAITNGIF